MRETLHHLIVLATKSGSKNQSAIWYAQMADNPQERFLNSMQKIATEWLKTIPEPKGHYFAGFTDGEGSFNVSLRQRADHQMGWQIVLTFNVSQKESYILAQFKQLLGCGRLQARNDGVWYYVVSNPLSITERVIPFFERFPFLSQRKKKNFLLFKMITKLVIEKKHLTTEGLQEIIQLREQLNEGRGRKRKHTLQSYTKFCQENPQRLYVRPRAFRQESSRKI